MASSLLDTSVYVSAFRRAPASAFTPRNDDPESQLWLSAVVLEELYAGATDRNREEVKQLQRGFDRVDRIIVPTLDDWAQAGRVLAQLAAKYDYEAIGRGRLTNDALIAVSAARMKIKVITTNARDFGCLAEFCALQWQLDT
jgi:predicted nucleic acid-binding protein